MNSLERVITALECRVPDRVPVFEIAVDPSVRKAILPGAGYADFIDEMGLDCVFTRDFYHEDPILETCLSTDNTNIKNGDSTLVEKRKSTERSVDDQIGTFRDEWGIVRIYTGEDSGALPEDRAPIQSEEDLEQFMVPDPNASHRLGLLPELVKRFKGRKAIGFHLHDSFYYPSTLRGFSQFLVDLYTNPDLVRRLVNLTVDYQCALAKRGIEAGADIVTVTDDYAWNKGPFMSPDHFREFFLPGLAKVVDAIHSAGGYCLKHTDGQIEPILDMIVDTGIDALHPLEVSSGMNIADVKKRYGERICVCGSVDQANLLVTGSVQDTICEVKHFLRTLAPGGGYMVASSNTIHSQVNPENFLAMVDTVHRYGWYPISV